MMLKAPSGCVAGCDNSTAQPPLSQHSGMLYQLHGTKQQKAFAQRFKCTLQKVNWLIGFHPHPAPSLKSQFFD